MSFDKRLEAALLILLLIPSAVVAWMNLDMPQFGSPHDDSVYFVTAKSWADGQGHRIVSLPGQPWQTKYPPLYPVWLSIIWRLSPHFPENLQLATAFSWILFPVLLWLTRILLREFGFSREMAWGMVAWLAINPYLQLFSISLLSEIPFTILLIAVLLLARRSAWMAGIVAGIAYLTRTAGLPLLVAVPVVFVVRRNRRAAGAFTAAMLPFVIGWAVWSGSHKLHSDSVYLMYYVDYAGYQLYNVTWSNFPIVLWKNVDALLTGMGTLIVPFSESPLTKMMVQTIGAAMIVGTFRLARDREQTQVYAVFGGLFILMLAVWHYPANLRFLVPIAPLLLAGLAYQLQFTADLIRAAYRDPQQKRAAIAICVLLGALTIPIIRNNFTFLFRFAPQSQAGERRMKREDYACADRIKRQLPEAARVMAPNEQMLHLLTGRTTLRQTVPPVYWYEERFEDMMKVYADLPQIAKQHAMTHLFFNRAFRGDLTDEQHRRYLASVESDPAIEKLFGCGNAVVYAVR